MWPFAAGNEFITILIALVPVAIFILSNLFKATQKPVKPPGNPARNPNAGGVPGTVDLDSFLREAKKRKAQQQSQSPPPPPPQVPRPVVMTQTPKAQPKQQPQKPAQTIPIASRPNRQEKRRDTPTSQPKKPAETKVPTAQSAYQGQGPRVLSPQVADSVDRPRAVSTPKVYYGRVQSPVALALDLLSSGKAAPTSFVLQEIFGRPRSTRPFQLPEPSSVNPGGPPTV